MRALRVLALSLLLCPMLALAQVVTFVSSDLELNSALVLFEHDEISALAVSEEFYLGSAKRTKDRLRGLMAGLREKDKVAIYLYGHSLNRELAEELLGEKIDPDCSPPVFAGFIYQKVGGVYIGMCGMRTTARNEEALRNAVRANYHVALGSVR